MIQYNDGYLVSDSYIPMFNKRRNGKYYAKLNLDTYSMCQGMAICIEAENIIKELRGKIADIKYTMKTVTEIPSLYKHQSVACNLIIRNTHVALFMEQGTGKTLSALKAIEFLYKAKEVDRVLVVCPKRIIREWVEQAHKFGIDVPVHRMDKGKSGSGINVINYELVWRRELGDFDMIVLDESHKIKHSGAKVSRYVCGMQAKRKVIMTGTSGEKPESYFGQYKFLEPMMFGENLLTFKDIFTNYDRETGAVWGLKASMKQKFWARVHSLSYWVKKEECLDLPEQIMKFEYITLPKDVIKLHNTLEKNFIASWKSNQIVCQNKLVSTTYCHQIAQGKVLDLHIHSEKLKALKGLEISEPVVIFTQFKQDVADILTLYPNASVVDGSHDDIERFLRGETDIAIINYASGSTGLNLQRASLMVMYSLTYSYTDYVQAMGRIHRIGQNRHCVYVHLVAEDTIDERIVRSLNNKEDFVITGGNHERKQIAETD